MEKITRYPSIAALADAAAEINPDHYEPGRDHWFGGELTADSLRYARAGNDRLVPDAEQLLAKIKAAVDLPERPMIADCVGAYPIVPDYLMGAPDCMRRRAMVDSDESPISIYVCLTSSARVPADQMMRRGVAILALVMALAPVRAVDLHVFNVGRRKGGTRESVILAPINTRPLDLAGACYALTSPGFTRRLCYSLAQAVGFGATGHCGIAWPEHYGEDSYLPGLLARLGGDPARDLILPASHINDPIIADPVRWVNQQLDRFREVI